MNDLRFPFEAQLVEEAGQVAMTVLTTALLIITGPPETGETPQAWRARLEAAGSELMNSILLAVQARQAVMTAAAEAEGQEARKQ